MINYEIRPMKPDEMELAIDWAHKEGWNPGLNDAKCFYNADPNGFFVGLVNFNDICCKIWKFVWFYWFLHC